MKKLISVVAALAIAVLIAGCSQQGGAGTSTASSSGESQSTTTQSASSASSASDIKSYAIARIAGEPNWNDIAQVDIDEAEWTDSFGISAHAQLCHDDQALYVRLWAEEQDVRATYAADDPFAKCYEDSCLEFFLSPVADDARYLNFEFNPNCAFCNEIGTQKTDRVKLLPSTDALNPTSSRTADGWEITYRIPFDYIQALYPAFSPKAGTQMRGNFYKCGNLTANKHYLVWNHVDSETPNFHVPSSFGALTLE